MNSKMEEYLKRQIALGYGPSLAGMDEEDFDYVPSWAARNRPPEQPLNREYGPVDRDFAERIFRMFARPRDPNWKMPKLDGPEYRQRIPGPQEDSWGAMGIGPKRGNAGTGVQLLSYTSGGGDSGDDRVTVAKPGGEIAPFLTDAAKELFSANEFGREVEKEARERGDSPELAKKKGEDAAGTYWAYNTAVAGASAAAKTVAGNWGGGAVGVAGTYVGSEIVKPKIKEHVLSKTEADYNTMFPGTVIGPG